MTIEERVALRALAKAAGDLAECDDRRGEAWLRSVFDGAVMALDRVRFDWKRKRNRAQGRRREKRRGLEAAIKR